MEHVGVHELACVSIICFSLSNHCNGYDAVDIVPPQLGFGSEQIVDTWNDITELLLNREGIKAGVQIS